MAIKTCIFDAYGTLFDVSAAAREAAQEPEYASLKDTWAALAEHWRQKQLQYTWLCAVTGAHTDFWQVTQDGLDWAMEKTGLGGDESLRARLLQLYEELRAYPEVPQILNTLKTARLQTGILSNGAPGMLTSAVNSAGISDQLDAILSVESVGIFKPASQVYDMVQARFGGERSEVLFVSSNGWDVTSATAYGFTTAWVNRAGEPLDRLPDPPTYQLSDLTEIPALVGVS